MINRFVKSFLVSLSLHGHFTERYADVADERGQGSGEVRRRLGTAIALGQLCSYPYNVFGK
jgi:hypothetical protein